MKRCIASPGKQARAATDWGLDVHISINRHHGRSVHDAIGEEGVIMWPRLSRSVAPGQPVSIKCLTHRPNQGGWPAP